VKGLVNVDCIRLFLSARSSVFTVVGSSTGGGGFFADRDLSVVAGIEATGATGVGMVFVVSKSSRFFSFESSADRFKRCWFIRE